MKRCDLFIFAGESSGDVHGELLLQELQKMAPDLTISGVGGPRMRRWLSSCFISMESFLVMGFIDIIKASPRLFWNFHKIKRHIKKTNPKATIFIDYPGFTIRLENALRKGKYPGKLVHYISPTVWAWGKWRLAYMIRNLDLLFSIYPFEKEFLESKGMKAHYIGHPLVGKVKQHRYVSLPIEGLREGKVLAIFPGSRPKEIERNFALQLKTACQMPGYKIAISVAESPLKPALEEELRKQEVTDAYLVDKANTYELMRRADAAIATSGTVTLELALHCVPTVVTYGMSFADLFLAKYLFKIRLPRYCIVNILLNQEIFPELYGPHFTESRLKKSLEDLDLDACKKQCSLVETVLTEKRSSHEAAVEILKLIQKTGKIPGNEL